MIRLTLIESARQEGATWSLAGVIGESDRSVREPHWVTPRITLLSDGRLAVICDRDDYEHCHEYQESGNHIWWSSDLGKTWSETRRTRASRGSSRTGSWSCRAGGWRSGRSMTVRRDAEARGAGWCASRDDGGRTWSEPGWSSPETEVHMYCEGGDHPAAEREPGVCSCATTCTPTTRRRYSFSFDNGLRAGRSRRRRRSPAIEPFVGQLADGRLLGDVPQPGRQPGDVRLAGGQYGAGAGGVPGLGAAQGAWGDLALGGGRGCASATTGRRRRSTTCCHRRAFRKQDALRGAGPRREPPWRAPGQALRPGAAGARQRAPHAGAERALPERLRFPAPPDRPPLPGGT